jgi:Fe-S oxidoreductase
MLDLEKGLLKDPAAEIIAGGIISEEVIWQCTTCGACTDQCPVGIDQVVPILDIRRGLVANGSFPETFTTMFKNLETSGNPWAYPAEHGQEFVNDQGFPIYEKGAHDVLYWMGCLGRNDDKYRKTASAFRRVLDAAGVKWGVLADEKCTGDAARRAGNEFLFTMLCEGNVEVLNAAAPKKIVATCPHCVRTIEEYRDFGLDPAIEITHHAAFIDELTRSGALKLDASGEPVTYHDPCYISRYQKPNGVEAPRRVLEAAGATITEPRRTGSRSFCCGAGGAMVFAEETEGKRINHERVDELLETNAKTVAVGCPFCRLMVSDGLADRGHEDVAVKDIAQITAERLTD